MVASCHGHRKRFAVIAYRLTAYPNDRMTRHGLYFPHQHERLVVAVELPEARSIIDDFEMPVGIFEFGAKHVCVGDIILVAGVIVVFGPDVKVATLFGIEQVAKDKLAVELTPAHEKIICLN